MKGRDQQDFDSLMLKKYEESLRQLQHARRALYAADIEVKEAEEEIRLLSVAMQYAEKTYFPCLENGESTI